MPVDAGGSLLDLILTAIRTSDGLRLRLGYNTARYDPATIDDYLGSLTSLITTVSHDPGARLRALLEPTPRER